MLFNKPMQIIERPESSEGIHFTIPIIGPQVFYAKSIADIKDSRTDAFIEAQGRYLAELFALPFPFRVLEDSLHIVNLSTSIAQKFRERPKGLYPYPKSLSALIYLRGARHPRQADLTGNVITIEDSQGDSMNVELMDAFVFSLSGSIGLTSDERKKMGQVMQASVGIETYYGKGVSIDYLRTEPWASNVLLEVTYNLYEPDKYKLSSIFNRSILQPAQLPAYLRKSLRSLQPTVVLA